MSSPGASESRGRSLDLSLLIGTILFILCIQIYFVFNFNINWDEFLYLSLIFEYSSGTLTKSLQTFHTHFFSWFTILDWDEAQLILLSRIIMLCCELATLGFIFLISRKFVSIKFALFGVASYLASGFVLTQGFSFRADPIITALLMASIYLLMDRSNYPWRFLAAAAAVALACAISIKSIFFIPPLIGALGWKMQDMEALKSKLTIFFGFAFSVLVLALILFFWHRSTLALGATNGISKFESIFSKVFVDIPFWPQKRYFLSWITASWPQILLILAGCVLLWKRHNRKSTVELKVILLFTLPILSIFFYRNAYPYFFPFIVAPLMIGVSIGVQEVSKNVSRSFTESLITIFLIYMVACTTTQAYLYSFHHQTAQREIIATIHTMFPERTAYIDRNSMISTFPKCGFFMSSWGVENYRKKGKPIFEQVLKECEPKFLITNNYQLTKAMSATSSEESLHAFFDKDARTLQSNFIHHWGRIWVAGKSFNSGISSEEFLISIEGTYTVESPEQVIIDRQQYNDGDTVFLSTGSHIIDLPLQQVKLRIGRHLPQPDFTPTSPIYFNFLWSILNMIK
jgi:hypothetical protein